MSSGLNSEEDVLFFLGYCEVFIESKEPRSNKSVSLGFLWPIKFTYYATGGTYGAE